MAAPMPQWLKENGSGWLGGRVFELYGGTERRASTIIPGTEWVKRWGSVGRVELGAAKGVGRRSRPAAGRNRRNLPEKRRRSRHDLPLPRRRAEARNDGWESLGDIGRIDAEGYIWLADRRTDTILRGGANVYPAEIEAALIAHPDIASCAVVGLPHPDLGSTIHAVLQLRDGADGDANRSRHAAIPIRTCSASPKHPKAEISSETVRDDAGKVRRTMLRDERVRWLNEGREFRVMARR